MQVKQKIKSLIPTATLRAYQKAKSNIKLVSESSRDRRRYEKYALLNSVPDDEKNIKAAMIFFVHSIEKGLSHPNFRPEFGKRALTQLSILNSEFMKQHISTDCFEYRNFISVLKAYKKVHVALGVETPYFDSLFRPDLYVNASDIAGEKRSFGHTANPETIDDLLNFRTSVREFKDSAVTQETLQHAMKFVLKTPSVCNRQPWHIWNTMNPVLIKELLQIQGGYTGYDVPPVLSLVSIDIASFRGVNERNEPYVDGGLVLMNYLYGLTTVGLASCTLNLMLDHAKLSLIREKMGVPDSEALISFVVLGVPKNNYKVAKSARKDEQSVMKFID